MLERVVYTAVFVSDQDRALDFYKNVLGFEQRADNPTPDGPRFLAVGVKGQDFVLLLSGRGHPGRPSRPKAASRRPTPSRRRISGRPSTRSRRGA
jgi:catechol 2,3-dioxygenase-like lactoylglutathione lyase family enzyme